MEEIIIRHYRAEDREAVRNISWDTAFMGEPASIFFDGKEVFSSFLTEYFTDHEPESCFVAVNAERKVVGYLLGAKVATDVEKIFIKKIFFPLLRKALLGGLLFSRKNWAFIFSSLSSMFCRNSKMPDITKDYPATLHINIDKDYRKNGLGSRLMSAYLDYLVENKIKGVYLATLSQGAGEFFKSQGFSLVHEGCRSYFRHILKKSISIYIYGKKLI